jgi:AraC-like DNA-binding protein
MDVLSDVLRMVRLTGAVFFDVTFGAKGPWVAATPASGRIGPWVMPAAEHVIPFHLMLAGECWVEFLDDSAPPLRLTAGDVIACPMGDGHVMNSEPGLRAAPDLSLYQRRPDRPLPFVIGGGVPGKMQTRFVCGYLGCDVRPFNPILPALPRALVARSEDGLNHLVELFRLAVDESMAHRSGREQVLSKLAELMFVEVVRRHIEALPSDAASWFAALRDRHIGAALHLMHARPAEAWTVERLAHEVGLSRTVFADRFVQLVQDSPMQYLTNLRMQLATRLLERQGTSIAQVAREVGYESEAAFNRAFKKHVGVPPGAWRRGRHNDAPVVVSA